MDHDVVVKYPSENRWTFNPVILRKASTGEAPPRLSLTMPDPFTYGVGDFVKISSDLERVKAHQAGHGEWVESMKQVCEAKEWVMCEAGSVAVLAVSLSCCVMTIHCFPCLMQTLGKVGRVMEVYPDGDLKIGIRDMMWTFSPRNVSRLEGDGVPLTPGTSGKEGVVERMKGVDR